MESTQIFHHAHTFAALSGLALISCSAQAGEILREEFTVLANSSFDTVGWSAYFTQLDSAVIDWSSLNTGPGFIPRAGGYAFLAPSEDALFDPSGPALLFTTLDDSFLLSSVTSLAIDENMDASEADPASARFAMEIEGLWYASDFEFSSTTENGPMGAFTPVTLDGINFTDGTNWRLLTVALGDVGTGEITLADSPVGGSLTGNVTSVGVYSLPGNAGDHSRFDNYVVKDDSAEPFLETFVTPGPDTNIEFFGWTALLTQNDAIAQYAPELAPFVAGVASGDYGYFAPKVSADTANNPALIFTTKAGSANISSFKQITWDASADNADDEYRVALQVNGTWYASANALSDEQLDSGPANFVPLSFAPESFATASNWLTIENTSVGDLSPLSLGTAPISDLNGEVTAYGLFLSSGVDDEFDGDHIRFDNFSVDASFSSGTSDATITSFTFVETDLWEVTFTGVRNTSYELRTSTTLDFNPGILVEDLIQGNPSDPGTVSGDDDNIITTNNSGTATVQIFFNGNPADFVRVEARP